MLRARSSWLKTVGKNHSRICKGQDHHHKNRDEYLTRISFLRFGNKNYTPIKTRDQYWLTIKKKLNKNER